MSNNVDTLAHLTPLQHGMLHHSQRDPGSGLYVEQFSCVLQGALEPVRFEQAWRTVVSRHDLLKTLFIRLHEEKPVQVVRKQVTLPWTVLDWREVGAAQEPQRFEALLAQDRARGFDPSQAPLMRLHVVQLAGQRWRFLWTYHHAILDGWSMPILLGEVFQCYAAPQRALPKPVTDYRHYLAWLRRQDLDGALAFWTALLDGYRQPLGFAPSLQPPAALQAVDGALRLGTVHGQLPAAWAEAATRVCRAEKITLNTLCQGAFALLLARYADTDDVVHGLVVSGRTADVPGIERMVGLFINTLPVRARLDGALRAMQWLRRLQEGSQQVERHAFSPLPQVLQCAQVPRQQALFDTLYVFENYPGQNEFRRVVQAQGLEVDELRALEETNYGLALIVLPADGLRFHFTYDPRRFSAAAVQRMADQYARLLEQLPGAVETPLRELGLHRDPGAAVPWPQTPPPAPDAAQWLALHATRAPQRPALVAGGRCVSYAELHALVQAGRRCWTRLGYEPGQRVLLLHREQPLAALVMLLSALAQGVACVLPPPQAETQAPWASVAAAAASAAPLAGCVVAAGTPRVDVAPRCDEFVFEGAAAESPPVLEPAAHGGACELLSCSALGVWTLVRYEAAAVAQALAGNGDAGLPQAGPEAEPVRDVAVIANAWSPHTWWSALFTLGAGLSLHVLADREACGGWPAALGAAGRRWHSVRLDGAQTRRLDRGTLPPVATGRWVADARSLSASGRERLRQAGVGAALVRELTWPAAALPLAVAEAASGSTPGAGPWRLGRQPQALVLDKELRPAAVDARGHLALRGSAVPAGLWHLGQPNRAHRLQLREGPVMLTDLQAWTTSDGVEVELPQPQAATEASDPALLAHEQVLLRCEGVHELALVERLDGASRWGLTVFSVATPGADPAALQARLRQAVLDRAGTAPDVVLLAALPRRDGQPDRAALARGEARAAGVDAALAPRDAVETALHEIWCALLKRERIGLGENYFDLGGQSLLASVMLYQVQERLGVEVDMGALLQAPTIAGMAEVIRRGGSAASAQAPDLAAECALAEDVVPATAVAAAHAVPRHVFLTGATGFLGVHLLAELLERTPAQLHCLVRAPDAQAGAQRLRQALQAHGLWQPVHAARIVPVVGELGPRRFGLGEAAFEALARQVDAIYHNGAAVNFVYPYAELKAVNVDATVDVLRLACAQRVKPVHYVSTVGVLDRLAEQLPETLSVPLHSRLMGGYEQSKWVAEQLVCAAGARGVPVAVYRPSRIVGHSRTGQANTGDLFCRLIKGVVLLGQAPASTGYDNMVPVDVAAAAIVEASQQPAVLGRAVHVVNPLSEPFDALVDFIASRGHAVERVGYEHWLSALELRARHDPNHPLAALLPVLHKLNPQKDASLARAMPLGCEQLLTLAPQAASRMGPAAQWLPATFEYLHRHDGLPRPVPVEA